MQRNIIVGIDEAGRGPLAGPVIAVAFCILDVQHTILNTKLRDSKLLSAKQRNAIYAELYRSSAVEWGIGQVSHTQIDKINIYQATRLAMKRAVLSLERKLKKHSKFLLVHKIHDREFTEPTSEVCKDKMCEDGLRTSLAVELIIDGNMVLDLPMRQKAVIKADTIIPECMAAGIIAKVTRDRLMLRLHKQYPQYGFNRHKGYGTKFHVQALNRFGPCKIHRASFSPIRDLKVPISKTHIPNNFKSQT
jgi:ribonuclease HII